MGKGYQGNMEGAWRKYVVCGEMEKAAGHSGPPLFLSVQNLLLGISDSLDIVIHQMPANIAVEEPLYCRELLAVLPKKSSGQS